MLPPELTFHQLYEIVQQQNESIRQLTEINLSLRQQLDIALNTIAMLREENQQLRDEIAILKGQKPRPKIPPSDLEGPNSKNKQSDKDKPPRGKHPRKKKTSQLHIHQRRRLKPELIPEGAVFKGCQKYTVQDIVLQSFNTVYEIERWQLPDGTYLTAKLPENIEGHYGPQLVVFVLHQYYSCRITAPLLLNLLKEMGVLISAGQLNNILIHDTEAFHQEKEALLAAGIAATGQIKVDDTGARHCGNNRYSTVVGNEYFTSITTTESKSRLNFLRILHQGTPAYLVNEDTAAFVEALKPGHHLGGYLLLYRQNRNMNEEEWKKFLHDIAVIDDSEIKLATEAALMASIVSKGVPKDLGVHGDDAGQFNAFVRSLCWIHEERHYRKIIPSDDAMRKELEDVREEIWKIYRGLQEYQKTPLPELKVILENKFDALFQGKKLSSPTLQKQLRKTWKKRAELLRVLERPTTPLHNNGTETDAREMVTKRKVSGGTRSDEGLKCRDTFISLKRTCGKLGISFWAYLRDRVNKRYGICWLAQEILSRSRAQYSTA
jgi:hypothetical protein